MSAAISASISERDLQQHVVAMAKALSWSVFHPWSSVHSAAGWPDLFMVRDGRALAVELKSQAGKITWQQEAWLNDLQRVPGIRTAYWRPADLMSGEVERALRGERAGSRPGAGSDLRIGGCGVTQKASEEGASQREADIEALWRDAEDKPIAVVDLGTQDLPGAVVSEEVQVLVCVTTDADDPRSGALGMGLRLGGRDNPTLSAVSAEYVASCLEAAAAVVRSRRMGRGRDDE